MKSYENQIKSYSLGNQAREARVTKEGKEGKEDKALHSGNRQQPGT